MHERKVELAFPRVQPGAAWLRGALGGSNQAQLETTKHLVCTSLVIWSWKLSVGGCSGWALGAIEGDCRGRQIFGGRGQGGASEGTRIDASTPIPRRTPPTEHPQYATSRRHNIMDVTDDGSRQLVAATINKQLADPQLSAGARAAKIHGTFA